MKHKPKLAVRVKQSLGDLFEMPSEPINGGMKLTVTDGNEVYMDGCTEILGYEEECIRVSTSLGVLTVYGSGLDIPKYSDGELTVRGTVTSVEIKREEKR